MTKDSKKLVQYIIEAGFAGPGSSTSKSKPAASSSASSAPRKPKNRDIMLDPKVMGPDAIVKEVEAAVPLISGPYKATMGIFGALSPLGAGAKDVLNAPARALEDIKAQQEAQRNMTNVANYYRNLGIKTIPMHGGQASLVGKIKSLLGLSDDKK